MTRKYVLHVPYEHDAIDLSAFVSPLGISANRTGPVRRLTIECDEEQIEQVRSKLPSIVVIEPLAEYGFSNPTVSRDY